MLSRRLLHRTAAAVGLAGSVSFAPDAVAQAPGCLGPQGSVQTSSGIPGRITPQDNRLVAAGFNGGCLTWVNKDTGATGSEEFSGNGPGHD